MKPVTEIALPGNCNYIPHHPIIREDKNSSKLKIVFDESARHYFKKRNSKTRAGNNRGNLMYYNVNVLNVLNGF